MKTKSNGIPGRLGKLVIPTEGATVDIGRRWLNVECDKVQAEGFKADDGKLRWDLLPYVATEHVVDVLTFGAKKYAPENWRKVDGWRWRYMAAAMRHIVAWKRGERLDKQTKKPHLAHAICCLMFMLELDGEGSDR